MNKLVIIIFALLISDKSLSQAKISIDHLIEFKNSFSNKNEEEFLKNFPRNFSDFKSTFGWNDKKDIPEPLYTEANNYIDYWFSIIEKDKYTSYESQIVSISKNGYWEADAVNYFKEKSINYIKTSKKYYLINELLDQEAQSVLSFLFEHSQKDSLFISYLNPEKQSILRNILSKNISSKNKRSTIATYENNLDYFIKTFDVNNDNIPDKIVCSKPYQGEDLFIFLGNKKGSYILALETTNFSEDGGNVIRDILPLNNNLGLEVKTYFPDRGFYEKEYYLIFRNNSWVLQNIIYKTMSGVSEHAVKYICDIYQNIDITKYGWMEKINPIPEESERNKKCRIESVNTFEFFIEDPDGFTNLRKEKNASSEILQKIKSGENIEVLDNTGDWFLVKTQQGNRGYVHKSRIKSK
ncbi:SH3 domain-containing protein [Flavobacterium sp. B17]|uniref:SH3 domain-containing protein n=1 Tax=Flavobacterium sp. B17 TaxID=95618 RepID=UPI00034BACC6|nr:SH3 domain-containing protein [Flavobacterium sp. B17]